MSSTQERVLLRPKINKEAGDEIKNNLGSAVHFPVFSTHGAHIMKYGSSRITKMDTSRNNCSCITIKRKPGKVK